MKKFLWLAVILTVFNGDANAVSPFATCSLHTSSKCATSRGFIAEGKQGCAGPETRAAPPLEQNPLHLIPLLLPSMMA